jgi:hypothetical protein
LNRKSELRFSRGGPVARRKESKFKTTATSITLPCRNGLCLFSKNRPAKIMVRIVICSIRLLNATRENHKHSCVVTGLVQKSSSPLLAGKD